MKDKKKKFMDLCDTLSAIIVDGSKEDIDNFVLMDLETYVGDIFFSNKSLEEIGYKKLLFSLLEVMIKYTKEIRGLLTKNTKVTEEIMEKLENIREETDIVEDYISDDILSFIETFKLKNK